MLWPEPDLCPSSSRLAFSIETYHALDCPQQEPSYGRLRAALNAEYMRYVFMSMILEDETDPVLRQVYDNATAVMRQYTRAFGGVEQANATLAHDNLVALEAYILTFEMQPPDPDESSDEERRLYDEGEKLYDRLWQADELEDALDERLKQLGQGERVSDNMKLTACHGMRAAEVVACATCKAGVVTFAVEEQGHVDCTVLGVEFGSPRIVACRPPVGRSWLSVLLALLSETRAGTARTWLCPG